MPDSSEPLLPASLSTPEFAALLDELAEMSPKLESAEIDPARLWPAEQFARLADAGVLGWVIPRRFGGTELSAEDLNRGYEALAAACLVTTFVLTQRNGACQRIGGCDNADLKSDLLPRLAADDVFATVGVSHLTTSRQHFRAPAIAVRETDRGFVLEGNVPWVTGAPFADYVMTGGTCDDGRQMLVAIPMDHVGVTVRSPPRLLALNASQTASIELDGVELDRHWLIAGPVEKVMQQGEVGGTGSVTTSALAVGHAAAAIARLAEEAERRPDLVETHKALAAERAAISSDMRAVARGESQSGTSRTAESVRQRANSLVLRATQALLAASKGAGFVAGHPAERALREAMFFLVWSCPQPVVQAALREFACGFAAGDS
ncbi:MAG: acyl-CoA dehydrogenase family protein [Planctomycetaceae bacterium]